MPLYDQHNLVFIPVVTLREELGPDLHGAVFQVDALRIFNAALAATAAEEHS